MKRLAAAIAAAALLAAGGAVAAQAGSTPPQTGPAPTAAARPQVANLAAPVSGTPAPPTPTPQPSAAPPSLPLPGRLLAVPVIAQVENLSCEAASLEMALAYRGWRESQADLLAMMRPDYARPEVSGGVVTSWSDPYDHFVGDPDGHEYDHTGYGVYYPVVARVAAAVGARVAWSGTGLTWPMLAASVLAGRTAVVWIAYDGSEFGVGGPLFSYRAWDGRRVPYAPGFEHTVTVAGVSGDAVLVNNPRWGYRVWLARRDFMAAIAPFGGMAVVLA